MDAGAIAHLAQMILNHDSKLKVSVMKTINSFSKKIKKFNSPGLHYVRGDSTLRTLHSESKFLEKNIFFTYFS